MGKTMSQGPILLVEDNADDVELALMAFNRNNIANEIVIAWDGAEALDYLFGMGNYAGRDTRQMPSLILLDLNLPKLSGLDVLRRVRADERTQFVPIVILSTSMAEQDVERGYRYGANSFIAKPMGFESFSEVVKQLGKYWLGLNIAPFVSGTAGGRTGNGKTTTSFDR
jgi:two-component system response regulator